MDPKLSPKFDTDVLIEAVLASLTNAPLARTDATKTDAARTLFREATKRHCKGREEKLRALRNRLASGADADALKPLFIDGFLRGSMCRRIGATVFQMLADHGLTLSPSEAADVAAVFNIQHLLVDGIEQGEVMSWDRYYKTSIPIFERLQAEHAAKLLDARTHPAAMSTRRRL